MRRNCPLVAFNPSAFEANSFQQVSPFAFFGSGWPEKPVSGGFGRTEGTCGER
jgi:hypothetical protein